MEYNTADEFIYCPMVNDNINIYVCIENCDIVDGLIKSDDIINYYGNKLVSNWREVCSKCKYHE